MNVHCTYCRHSFNLTRDYMVTAVAEAQEKRQKYHAIECPSCRKTVKVSIRQMRRYVPRNPVGEEEE